MNLDGSVKIEGKRKKKKFFSDYKLIRYYVLENRIGN